MAAAPAAAPTLSEAPPVLSPSSQDEILAFVASPEFATALASWKAAQTGSVSTAETHAMGLTKAHENAASGSNTIDITQPRTPSQWSELLAPALRRFADSRDTAQLVADVTQAGVPGVQSEGDLFHWLEAQNAAMQFCLGLCHRHNIGTPKAHADAARMFRSAAERGNLDAIDELATCYLLGVGEIQDKVQAVREYQSAVLKGHGLAHYHLGCHYLTAGGAEAAKAPELLRSAIARGVADARAELGWCYATGAAGVAKDGEVAATLLELAAEEGSAVALYRLAMCLDLGIGAPADEARAFELYKLAAQRGNAAARVHLGALYENGFGVEKDVAKAVALYQAAAAQGHARGQYVLGACHERGVGVAKDLIKARELYTAAANQNDVEAQYTLAINCLSGGWDVTPSVGLNFMHRAADRGHALAVYSLGVLYERGLGVDRDPARAAGLYLKAAKAGIAMAQFNLGAAYRSGAGVPQDHTKAAEWFMRAAEQGFTEAMIKMGERYEDGVGVAKDDRKAVEMYAAAAKLGDSGGQTNLGFCYAGGIGVAQDDKRAAELFTLAARQGNPDAQNNLGTFYESGIGVEKDTQKAIHWYTKAAQQGHPAAQEALQQLRK